MAPSRQRHVTRNQSQTDASQSPVASDSASCASSPASPPSPPSSPPPSRPPSTTQVAEKDRGADGTISPATIYQHYECVARRLFRAQETPTAHAALDWPVLGMSVTLDELPISSNGSLPEYQLTQEWFERVVAELREVEESRAKAAGGVDDSEEAGHER